MGVPSRTSAPTPALDQTFDIQIILGKVRPFLRRLAEAHPQVLIIAPRRALGCAPSDRIDADRAAMLGLPPVAPATGWSSSLRLPRDHYIRLDGNDYSVHPAAVGRPVLVRADLDRVQAFCDGQTVAEHTRIWATHQTISDPGHVEAAKILRHRRTQIPPPPLESEVPVRDLSSYDTALGVDLDGGAA